MEDKSQTQYLERAKKAELSGMFREAIKYYSMSGDYSNTKRLKRNFVETSKDTQRMLGITKYLGEKREERMPEFIGRRDLEYFSTKNLPEEYFEN